MICSKSKDYMALTCRSLDSKVAKAILFEEVSKRVYQEQIWFQ